MLSIYNCLVFVVPVDFRLSERQHIFLPYSTTLLRVFQWENHFQMKFYDIDKIENYNKFGWCRESWIGIAKGIVRRCTFLVNSYNKVLTRIQKKKTRGIYLDKINRSNRNSIGNQPINGWKDKHLTIVVKRCSNCVAVKIGFSWTFVLLFSLNEKIFNLFWGGLGSA